MEQWRKCSQRIGAQKLQSNAGEFTPLCFDTQTEHIPDSRIRLNLYTDPSNPLDTFGGVWFHNNQVYYNLGVDTSLATYNAPIPFNNLDALSAYGDSVLNVFFIERPTDPAQCLISGAAPAGTATQPAAVYGMYSCHEAAGGFGVWDHYYNVIHEIGHTLNLRHTANCNNPCRHVPNDIDSEKECNTMNLVCGQSNAHCSGRKSSGTNNFMAQVPNDSIQNFTPCQLGIIHEFLNRRQYDYLVRDFCEITRPDIVIEDGEDIHWNSSRRLSSNVIIENGAKLTITCTIGMPEGAKFIVKNGGKLVVDVGTTTKNCENSWQGIDVWGDPESPQIPPAKQGFVRLLNDATLEFAQNAVSLSDSEFSTKGGGLVWAESCHFINNKRSVEFIQYKQHNNSYFKSCTFDLDEDYNQDKFLQHLSMWDVRGVKISGCDFLKNNENVNPFESEGILSIDAAYAVNGSLFSGFTFGIHSSNAEGLNTFSVENSKFQDNSIGIYSGAVSGISVTNNTFEVGDRPVGIGNELKNHGIFVEGGTGYEIEDNGFSGVGAAYDRTGILIKNTGGESNQVLNNKLENLEFGTLSNGVNYDLAFDIFGLQYECNSNHSN